MVRNRATILKDDDAALAIEELGGLVAVATLFGEDTRVISNWQARKRLPASTYEALAPLLSRAGVVFPGALFGQRQLVNRPPPPRGKRQRNGAR